MVGSSGTGAVRSLVSVGLAISLAGMVSACGGGDTASSAPPSTTTLASPTSPASSPSPATPATSSSPSSSTSSATSAGPTVGVPAGAGSVTTVDLDGDGRPDTLWLADVDGRRTLGMSTSGHGTQSVVFTSAAPQAAAAQGVILEGGQPVVLLDTGRSVQLYGYRVENPGLVELNNPQGRQYGFSLGFTDVGTGLVCESVDGGLQLYGVDARNTSDSSWTVTRTEVVVDVNHSSAHNGATTTVAADVSADDPAVASSHGTTCGTGAGSDVAAEPQS